MDGIFYDVDPPPNNKKVIHNINHYGSARYDKRNENYLLDFMGGVLFLDYHAGKQEFFVQKNYTVRSEKKYIHLI